MQGKILDYNSEFKSGLIRGEDGNKYRFSIDDCKSDLKPRPNAEVDFEPNGDKAVEVYILTKDTVDAIKDIASSAVTATTNVAKEAVKKTKSIIPIIITLIILGGIGLAISYVFNDYLPKQKRLKIEEERIALMNEGNKLLKSGDYQNAISKYESAKTLDTDIYYDSYRQCVIENPDGPCGHAEQYDFKIAHAYIGLNNPDKALQLLADPSPDTHEPYQSLFVNLMRNLSCDNQSGCSMAVNKAYYCSLTSKAYRIKHDEKSADVYARIACDHGDCSMVEK